jgi:hypothetical protein
MRLFADGIFEYDDGKVGPSFSTCDLIDPSQSTKLGFRSLEWKILLEETENDQALKWHIRDQRNVTDIR